MLFLETKKKKKVYGNTEIAAYCNCICSLLKFFLHRIFCSQVLVPLEFPGLFSATVLFLLLFSCLFNSVENCSFLLWGL